MPQPAKVIAAAAHRIQNPFPRLRPIITPSLFSARVPKRDANGRATLLGESTEHSDNRYILIPRT